MALALLLGVESLNPICRESGQLDSPQHRSNIGVGQESVVVQSARFDIGLKRLKPSIEQVANYVMQMGQPGSESHAGKAAYDQNCTACHGVDGEGNPMLGGPRLADDIWLYGGDIETVRETLTSGRVGVMPRFRDRLDDTQIKLLVALLAR